jgi:hypothetical protein
MKRFWTILIITAASAIGVSLAGQKIERETSDRTQIIHLRTALNHLTVIELREPVVQVATGSQSFKVEWRENKVFVQPTEADSSTNLFIWTATERLNYELEPAGDVVAMDFAVDQLPLVQPKPASVAPAPRASSAETLLAGKPVRLESSKASHKPVEVAIRDLYEGDGRLVVRYAIRNQGSHVYDASTPQVYELTGVRYPQSLYTLLDSQLGDQEAAHVTAKQQIPIPVLEAHMQTEHLAPGQESLGVVAFHLPSSTAPTIIRFEFPKNDKGQVAALLVR